MNVLQEAKQEIDPRLHEMVRYGGGGGGRGGGGWRRGGGGRRKCYFEVLLLICSIQDTNISLRQLQQHANGSRSLVIVFRHPSCTD